MNELEEILRYFDGTNKDELNDALIILEDVNSCYNFLEYKKFIFTAGFSKTNKFSLKVYLENISKIQMANLELIEKIKTLLEKNNKQWLFVSFKNANLNNNNVKLYLSVDNNSIHLFANHLVMKSLLNNYDDLNFKVNNNEDINRRDNVVIYCNKDNLVKYVNLVNELIEDHPEIVFNSRHLLGIPCGEHISLGIDNNSDISYPESLSNSIFNALTNDKDVNEIINKINAIITKNTDSINNYFNFSEKSHSKK